jgi:hypothetical protein
MQFDISMLSLLKATKDSSPTHYRPRTAELVPDCLVL